MPEMRKQDYVRQIEILDRRIDELTKPVPSRDILHAAKTIAAADPGNFYRPGTFTSEDYDNLCEAKYALEEFLPRILAVIRDHSIDPDTGWRFETLSNSFGDFGNCAICDGPFQHLEATVKVHLSFMRPGTFAGVCRECVGYYAPLEFTEREDVDAWRGDCIDICEPREKDSKKEEQRRDLIDAIRNHALATHYFGEIAQQAPKWAEDAFGEWR
ncbi:hypothetical protein [Rhodopirellula sp. MGV]|uniref:hypothetical protein n=1 Tax=Rhodopirellula sp. MGV TaxID=2023130 RepID=UPI000B960098|nr:hypothetical protein [Rhodopirellula sp. MGV]OYP33877.1 hypothetical protein CGZ80_16930 [Rhodopirellula sp. MGV]PNY37298.1 hypothetical protein C2E31_08430 [Rhodopirellula baltica]